MLLGAGVGITFMSISSVTQQYFDKKRTVANGFVMAGLSVGNFIFPPLARLILDRLGWRMALSLCSCVLMQNVWLCGFYRPPIVRIKDKTKSLSRSTRVKNYLKSIVDFSMLKDPVMILFLISCFLLSITFMGYHINLVNKALSEGVERYKAAFVASVSGVVNALWRPTFGVLATIPIIRKNKYLVLTCILALFGLSLGLLGAASTFETIAVSVSLVAVVAGK